MSEKKGPATGSGPGENRSTRNPIREYDPVQEVLSRLQGVKETGADSYIARCPVATHGKGRGDRNASLTVSRGDDWRALVHCHANCQTDAVLEALGMTARDLFPGNGDGTAESKSRIVATYDYCGEHGDLLYQSVRYDPKAFKRRRPDGKGGHRWNMQGVSLVLYNLPELLARPNDLVFLVEGEKDVASLQAVGLLATTFIGGANAWRDEYAEALRGRRVVILGDNDKAGRDLVQQEAESLSGKAADVRVLDLGLTEPHADVTDWLADHTAEELLAIVEATPQYKPGTTTTATRPANPYRPHVLSVCLSDVTPEDVHWLWPGRIPFGKITLLIGDPGLGKSFLSLDLAARFSTGTPWPDAIDEETEAGSTVILSAEDGLADTIRPRLDAAGADVTRIHAITAVQRSANGEPAYFSLADDIRSLEAHIEETGAKLAIIDPVTAYLSDSDGNSNTAIRSILGPVAGMAERQNCAVICITHLNKNKDAKAIYRSIGSIAFIAQARMAWAVIEDPDDDKLRLFLPAKTNLAEQRPGLRFHIEDTQIHWHLGDVKMSPDEAIASGSGTDRTERAEAIDWLTDYLATGPALATDLTAAAKAEGHSWPTVRRAQKALGIHPIRKGEGRDRPWYWELPSEMA